MKTILAAVALAGGLSLVHDPRAMKPAIDPTVTGATPAAAGTAVFELTNPAVGSACRMRRAPAAGDSVRLSPEPSCDAVWPGLAHAATLSPSGRGTSRMTGVDGRTILTFADGDGVAYEAIEPRSALVTVSLGR